MTCIEAIVESCRRSPANCTSRRVLLRWPLARGRLAAWRHRTLLDARGKIAARARARLLLDLRRRLIYQLLHVELLVPAQSITDGVAGTISGGGSTHLSRFIRVHGERAQRSVRSFARTVRGRRRP